MRYNDRGRQQVGGEVTAEEALVLDLSVFRVKTHLPYIRVLSAKRSAVENTYLMYHTDSGEYSVLTLRSVTDSAIQR